MGGLGVLCAVAGLAACGKRGDPLEPLPRNPQGVAGVRLAQRGDRLEKTLVAPTVTTGGARLGVMEIETSMAAQPGEMAKVAARTTRRAAPGETVVESEPLPPVGTAVRLSARAIHGGAPSVPSAVATLTVQSPPPAPTGLVASLEGEAVSLRWEGTIPSPIPSPSPSPATSPSPAIGVPALDRRVSPPSPEPSPATRVLYSASPTPSPASLGNSAPLAGASPPTPGASPAPSPSASPTPPPKPTRGFLVYRRDRVTPAYATPLVLEPLQVKTHRDAGVSLGQDVCYTVMTAISMVPLVESGPSNEACVAVKDVVAPAGPAGVAALTREAGIEVSWSPSGETDLQGYRVYRATDGGPPQRVGEVPVEQTTFVDPAPPRGSAVSYHVTAVDRAGNESSPSAAAEMRLP